MTSSLRATSRLTLLLVRRRARPELSHEAEKGRSLDASLVWRCSTHVDRNDRLVRDLRTRCFRQQRRGLLVSRPFGMIRHVNRAMLACR